MSTPAERLRQARKAAGFRSAAEFARQHGIEEVTYRSHENGVRGIPVSAARHYGKLLATSWQWILTGEGDPKHGPRRRERATLHAVPVIDRVRAGQWSEVVDPHQPGDGSAWLYADMSVGPRSFALDIIGDSMEPLFREGDRIIVDPDIAPRPGDFVVAKLADETEATFKEYEEVERAKGQIVAINLRPLNSRYPVLRLDRKNPGRIVGVMIEHRRYRTA